MRGSGIVGNQYGRLTVIRDLGVKDTPSGKYRKRYVECLCACGALIEVTANSIKAGNTSSCGCLFHETLVARNTTHGKSKTLLFKLWAGIISRCEIPSATGYENYGGRGIKVCKRWRDSFEKFAQDVGEKPSPRHSLDRVDNHQGYKPGNVRWATPHQQIRNSRKVRLIKYGGVTATIAEWARASGMSPQTLGGRLTKGWKILKAITTPTRLSKRGGFLLQDILRNVRAEIRK